EQHDEPLQSTPRPRLNGEEVRRYDQIPMLFQEFLPGGLSFPLRRRLNPVSHEDVGYRPAAHIVTQIGERALDAPVTPGAILGRDASNQSLDFLRRPRSAGPPFLAPVVFQRD